MNHTFQSDQILYEDNHLFIINKKSGQIVQADKTEDTPLVEDIKNFIIKEYNKPGAAYVGIPHRLDRPTTGIVIFTKTSKGLERMVKQFKEKTIEKTYWALVDKKPEVPEATLENYLIKRSKNNKSYVTHEKEDGAKFARLKYKTCCQLDNYTLLEIKLETGRHHQIRVQLSHLGLHIKGDLKYGFKRPNLDKGISLHARKIKFKHPTLPKMIEIIAPVISADNIWKSVPGSDRFVVNEYEISPIDENP